MLLAISDIVSRHEASALFEASASLSFTDGRATAGRHAKHVKNNEQASQSDELGAILDKVRQSLLANAVFTSATRPKHFVRLLVSRYRPGMAYGSHVDDALMEGMRTDVSFTLFLSPSDTYEGGELVIEDALEERLVRLEAGEAFVYPSTTVHRVEPVTSGERVAVVGWVQSWIHDPAQRQIMFDLDQAVDQAAEDDPSGAQFKRLARSRSNLLRMWAQ